MQVLTENAKFPENFQSYTDLKNGHLKGGLVSLALFNCTVLLPLLT